MLLLLLLKRMLPCPEPEVGVVDEAIPVTPDVGVPLLAPLRAPARDNGDEEEDEFIENIGAPVDGCCC